MATENPLGQQLDVTNMPLDQLNMVKEQLQAELEKLDSSLKQLQVILGRFKRAGSSIASLAEQEIGTGLMIPVTESIYVPGEVVENTKVMVDIGTGFIVEKSIAEGVEFFKRKAKMITEQIGQLSEAMGMKQNNLQATFQLIQKRMTEEAQ